MNCLYISGVLIVIFLLSLILFILFLFNCLGHIDLVALAWKRKKPLSAFLIQLSFVICLIGTFGLPDNLTGKFEL